MITQNITITIKIYHSIKIKINRLHPQNFLYFDWVMIYLLIFFRSRLISRSGI